VSALGLASAPAMATASSLLSMEYSSPEEILLAQRAIEDSTAETAPAPKAVPPELGSAPSEPSRAHKSAGLGVLYSLILPGAGHLYAGSKRGWINIGADVASWVTYLTYHDLGKSKEDEYQNYADAHWDLQRWLDSGCAACNTSSAEYQLITNFRDHNRQQYYEDIGKISTYFGGWDDNNNDPSVDPKFASANRRFYKGMRDHSNNFLKDADYGLAGALVNRVVSAVDVFRMLKARTSPMLGDDTQLRLHIQTKSIDSITSIGFDITKRLY
jgi:hypothetical protein